MTTPDEAEADPPPISAKQQRILTVIREWVQQRGYPPTVREIGAAVGLGSPSSVAHHLKALERRGLLRRDGNAPRAVDIRGAQAGRPPNEGAQHGVRVPVLGTVAAGAPILAEEHVEDELTLPSALVGHGTLFALIVKGDSMMEAAICDGDVVIVRQQAVAETGDIVAAMIEGEATVKVYRTRDGRVELVPRNPLYDVIPAEHAVILGKVVCVLRRV
ncbi:Repressor LexA [Micromonospora saelicesensis]|uniref:transcriptional repressor LexA n=1 Tax=Micromonospora saelicesensis TaxID=285676 RepID=UPI000DC0279A|nr:transcriptional repressor LexA [Micromonospora saelicesensis]RAO63420.1 Repressor LexA [Micromonospora saelicesensis]